MKKPFHDIGRSPEAVTYLAEQLERLMSLPLDTPVDIELWDKECKTAQENLEKQFPVFEPWHEVWHFYNDADIRARDKGYLEYQHGQMREYIRNLRGKN